MKEVKLPEIKLFGKKIALPENESVEAGDNSSSRKSGNENSSGSDSDCYLDPNKVCQVEESDDNDVNKQEADKISLGEECGKSKSEEEGNDPMVEEPENPKDLSDCDNSPDTPSLDEDPAGKQSLDSENDQSETNNSQGKNQNLKKPDKILPCPRCNSMETKFCYYNNYNVNQPRHFCKSCQRYWTAGGTMRNVPVGAGRRKNKNSVSSCRQLTISEALQAAQFDAANGFHHLNVKPNGTVLSFGPELPLNDSTTALLKLNKLDSGTVLCNKGTESGNDFSKGSSVTLPNQAAHGCKNGYQETIIQHVNSFPTPVPYFHNLPCPFPTPVPIPVPAICPPGFPMPFYPAPIWTGGIPGSWSFPWLPPVYPAANQKTSGFSSIPPTLGKHSRDGVLLTPKHLQDKELQDPKSSEGSILIPKTLRIGDPDEAAMSSIWTTLGIKCDSTNQGGLFKAAFQPKIIEKKQSAATSTLLQANPAAFSRSLNFQEIA